MRFGPSVKVSALELNSLDLRQRVVAAVAAGQSCRSVATTFMVSVASVVKWSQRHRAVGSPAALKMGGRRPYTNSV